MNKADLLEAAKALFHDLVTGETPPDEIAAVMGWDDDTMEKVRKQMLTTKADEARNKPADHVYVEYVIEQRRNVNDLTDLINALDKKSQYNAVVGSIRLRSEIADKILDRGFDFGMIKRANTGGGGLGAGNTFIFGGEAMNAMDAGQLRGVIGKQLNELSGFMTTFGDGKNISELTPGELHYGDVVEAEVVEAPQASPVVVSKAKERR